MKAPAFKIDHVYNEEAKRILGARSTSKIIHASGDIDASGDEIEGPVRDFLRRRLPAQYFVGHGHIVDQHLNVSPQFDVIIADAHAAPILFEGDNGVQYFPWESVYAVGEIKSTYITSKQYILGFAKAIQKLKTTLSREATPENYLGNGITLGTGLSIDIKVPLRNPLFSFIVFCDSNDVSDIALVEEYGSIPDEFLPAIACFLDGSIVVKAESHQTEEGMAIGNLNLNPNSIVSDNDIDWTRLSFTKAEKGGQCLAALMFGLFDHLNNCVLMRPPIADYLNQVLAEASHEAGFVGVKRLIQFEKASGCPFPEEFLDELKKMKGWSD